MNNITKLHRKDITGEQVSKMYGDGMSMAAIARQLGCADRTISLRLHDCNIKPLGRYERPGFRIEISKEKLVDLYVNHKLSSGDVGARLGCSGYTVLQRLKEWGVPIRKAGKSMPGKLNPFWKGGRRLNQDGYVLIGMPGHPRASQSSGHYVFEHIVIWEKAHGCPVPKGHVIHHLNGIKTDNRPENLEAMSRSEHLHQTKPYKERIRELEEELIQLKARLSVVT